MRAVPRRTGTVVGYGPDRVQGPPGGREPYVGRSLPRVDGPAKVTGEARFAAEHRFDGLVHARLVCGAIARGRIRAIDVSEAESAPGVIAVITHENNLRLARPRLLDLQNMAAGMSPSDLPVMQDERIHWNGQPVAVVVADTWERAGHAASLVRVDYDEETPTTCFDEAKADAVLPPDILGEPSEIRVGDAAAALSEAAVGVDRVYRTPWHSQSAIEPHATVAVWDGDSLTVHESTQFVGGCRHVLAALFGLAPENVRVLAPFVGGAFGGKWGVWTNTPLCAAAARIVGRPVKLVLSREEVFRIVGGRPRCEQRVALGADRDGRFTALVHTGVSATTAHARNPEQFSLTPRHLWASRTMEIGQRLVHLDTVANSWMRAPGETVGTFALESAVDELAHGLGMDPIELRRVNEPERDPTTGQEFSSRNLVEAYARGAERFGWRDRRPEPRSRRDGSWLVGQGVATAYYPVFRFPATARVRISADGTALVRAAANEMGMGTATAQLQLAADRLGLPIDRVSFEYGDSALPGGALSAGGSGQTASAAAAVLAAVEAAHRELLRLAGGGGSPLAGAGFETVQARDGGLYRTDDRRGESYGAVLARAGLECVEVEVEGAAPLELAEYSMASYGAQFCEVRVHERTGEVHVSRWLGSFDCGRIVNPRTAVSQFRGGIVMGIGAALTEDVVFDDRTGRVVNRSLAGYHVPAHLDVPRIDVVYTDTPDEHAPLGVHGVGEIGITGAAAAVANAVFNATGRRVRDLPITLDALL
ncbi:xanthine dehydrogenase family protein molybdopterin-binding subunit [Nocardiopsis sp. NPDC050513]|uniref:xanthine dehydrogenase family protein molybdopterin-binding subunit n=1 Tax=Nocardiopsis sp. NPDC050513 TaxID=3364338 RepID=UPI0037AFC05F